MKIRYPVIATIAILITLSTLEKLYIIMDYGWYCILKDTCLILLFVSLVLIVYRIIKTRHNSEETKELERQREAERREVEIVRKSNDILLHLIQDEHREDR